MQDTCLREISCSPHLLIIFMEHFPPLVLVHCGALIWTQILTDIHASESICLSHTHKPRSCLSVSWFVYIAHSLPLRCRCIRRMAYSAARHLSWIKESAFYADWVLVDIAQGADCSRHSSFEKMHSRTTYCRDLRQCDGICLVLRASSLAASWKWFWHLPTTVLCSPQQSQRPHIVSFGSLSIKALPFSRARDKFLSCTTCGKCETYLKLIDIVLRAKMAFVVSSPLSKRLENWCIHGNSCLWRKRISLSLGTMPVANFYKISCLTM